MAATPSLSASVNEYNQPALADYSLTEIELETSLQTTLKKARMAHMPMWCPKRIV